MPQPAKSFESHTIHQPIPKQEVMPETVVPDEAVPEQQSQASLADAIKQAAEKTFPEKWYGQTVGRSVGTGPRGYPKLAAFIDADPCFRIFRRFGFLRTRLMLYHQDILAEVEAELDALDRSSLDTERTKNWLGSRRDDEGPRKQLFEKLEKQLEVYDNLLKSSAAIYKLQAAPVDTHRQSVVNHIWNDGRLKAPDRAYILHIDDLAYLNPEPEFTWFQDFIRYLLHWVEPLVKNLFRNEVQKLKLAKDKMKISLYEKTRINRVIDSMFTLFVVALMMGSAMVLRSIDTSDWYARNGALAMFATSFALMWATATDAGRQEVVLVTAV
ncbi:hypothetical protein H2200_009651 [Cladophialophora chaetospira]|uniref:DUF6594 domain-containing protein n=1 Tax=Cladophialophora chaetospira TaxID=386627 RepID=A0AA38X2Y8_9EURO|nr:hypothetical protein H2200_009651 [Cladophialophora chaetospira]